MSDALDLAFGVDLDRERMSAPGMRQRENDAGWRPRGARTDDRACFDALSPQARRPNVHVPGTANELGRTPSALAPWQETGEVEPGGAGEREPATNGARQRREDGSDEEHR